MDRLCQLIGFVFIILMLARISSQLSTVIEEKVMRVTEITHEYTISSYGTVNLPGELVGTVRREERTP